MNPQDDPEARIRDLERPLSDLASTSELGTGQPGGDYAPNQWGHAMPYPESTQTPNAGLHGWVFAVAALAVCALAIAGGVAVYLMFAGGPTTTTPGRPTFNGGGGAFTNTPAGQPPETTVPRTVAPTAGPSVPGVPAGVVVNISGVGGNKTYACDGGSINVSGVNNTVEITGRCVSLSVSGVNNAITIDSADVIGVSGFDNRVTYRSGAPEVHNTGGSNVVEQG